MQVFHFFCDTKQTGQEFSKSHDIIRTNLRFPMTQGVKFRIFLSSTSCFDSTSVIHELHLIVISHLCWKQETTVITRYWPLAPLKFGETKK